MQSVSIPHKALSTNYEDINFVFLNLCCDGSQISHSSLPFLSWERLFQIMALWIVHGWRPAIERKWSFYPRGSPGEGGGKKRCEQLSSSLVKRDYWLPAKTLRMRACLRHAYLAHVDMHYHAVRATSRRLACHTHWAWLGNWAPHV